MVRFRQRRVRKVLSPLDFNKSAGFDGICTFFKERCPGSFILCRLFYLSYSLWKTSNGQRRETAPMTLIIGQLPSWNIFNLSLISYLERNPLISNRKYGFCAKRYTGDIMTFLRKTCCRSIQQFGGT